MSRSRRRSTATGSSTSTSAATRTTGSSPRRTTRGASARLKPILTGIPLGGIHDGGRIAFGPDGFLYASTGETGDSELAQDKKSLGGKILRITKKGKPAPGNPFGDEIYSFGHRNVQGLAWTDDGQLWASEFGQNTFDELNRIELGGNYGWPLFEGEGGTADGYVDPQAVWGTDVASPSGLAFADGCALDGRPARQPAVADHAGLRGRRHSSRRRSSSASTAGCAPSSPPPTARCG